MFWEKIVGLVFMILSIAIICIFYWFGKIKKKQFVILFIFLCSCTLVFLLIDRITKIQIPLLGTLDAEPKEPAISTKNDSQSIAKKLDGNNRGDNNDSVKNNQTKDPKQIEELAEKNDQDVQLQLGHRYYFGEGVAKDYKKAVKWYRKSANQGNAIAQNNLGVIYRNGYGVEHDYQEAVNWYRKSAEQGNAKAQYNLGVYYDNGEGVEQDYEEAVNWYKKSGEQGNATAQKNLGVCYCNGKGVLKSWVLAHMWLNLSAKGGKLLEDLEKKMTKEQVADALDRALKWKEKKEKEDATKS